MCIRDSNSITLQYDYNFYCHYVLLKLIWVSVHCKVIIRVNWIIRVYYIIQQNSQHIIEDILTKLKIGVFNAYFKTSHYRYYFVISCYSVSVISCINVTCLNITRARAPTHTPTQCERFSEDWYVRIEVFINGKPQWQKWHFSLQENRK